jgi:hypothetical protein
MIFLLSWISFFIILFLIYTFLAGKTKEWAGYLIFAVFFAGFFFMYDYTLNSSWEEIDKFAPTLEICANDNPASYAPILYNNCTTSKDYSALQQETRYLMAGREQLIFTQYGMLNMISTFLGLVLLAFLFYIIWHGAKSRRWIL